jgi:pimeloyl-ACP methyl ester carboxylesterase
MGIMRSIARGVALAGAAAAGGALAITASSVLATPQPLESALEGQGRLFRFRAGDVFYTVSGPADAPPVLLLHSVHLSASSFEWRRNFSTLSQSFRVYAPDLLGFGLSDRPAIDYTADLYVHLIADFARQVIARPTLVVARHHSAAFAVRAARRDSQFFTRLVFISPTGILPTAAEDRDWPARSGDALQALLRRISTATVGQVPYAFLTTKPALSWLIARQSYANPAQVTPEVVQHLFATTHQFGARFAPLAFMSGKLDLDVAEDFAALQQPILLVWGQQDAINDPLHAEALSRGNPHARLELIAQAGNAVQDEQAEEVNELLHAWFLAPPELVDPALRWQNSVAAPPPSAPAEQATPPAATTAAPLTEPVPEAPGPAEPTADAEETPGAMPQSEPPASAETAAEENSAAAEAAATAAPQPPKSETRRRATPRSTGAREPVSGQARQSKAAQQPSRGEGARQARSEPGDQPQPPRPAHRPRKKS